MHRKGFLKSIRLALITVVLGALILSGFGPPSVSWAQTYRGRVLDADTGEPLEGAVFVITWHKKPFMTMDGPQYFTFIAPMRVSRMLRENSPWTARRQ
jgi:hypothetical protein